MNNLVKECCICLEDKLMSEFYINSTSLKDGHDSRCKKCVRIYQKLRMENNASWKINDQLTSSLSTLIRGVTPSHRLLKIMNCNNLFFFKWLEFQFNENMNWTNYGKIWNIDHVIPVSSFNLLNEDELKRCYSWTNLRPCMKEENTRKANKVDYDLITIQKKQAHIFKNIYEESI